MPGRRGEEWSAAPGEKIFMHHTHLAKRVKSVILVL